MITNPRSEHKKALGIAGERIVIVAGYNASPRQHHLRIIAALHGLPEAERRRLLVILPMTMGGSSHYVHEVRAACIGSGMEHRIITDLMSDEDVARLRCATDIMVQVQPTDQLSGAMQEHLFAGTVVLTGAWLPYGVLCEAGVRFWTIPDRSALQEGIMECLNELGSRARLASANATAIHELSSWERNAPHWSALYD